MHDPAPVELDALLPANWIKTRPAASQIIDSQIIDSQIIDSQIIDSQIIDSRVA
jgi:hypothetical protein